MDPFKMDLVNIIAMTVTPFLCTRCTQPILLRRNVVVVVQRSKEDGYKRVGMHRKCAWMDFTDRLFSVEAFHIYFLYLGLIPLWIETTFWMMMTALAWGLVFWLPEGPFRNPAILVPGQVQFILFSTCIFSFVFLGTFFFIRWKRFMEVGKELP